MSAAEHITLHTTLSLSFSPSWNGQRQEQAFTEAAYSQVCREKLAELVTGWKKQKKKTPPP